MVEDQIDIPSVALEVARGKTSIIIQAQVTYRTSGLPLSNTCKSATTQ